MDLKEIRREINSIDYQVLELLAERLDLSPAVGDEVLDRSREEEIIKDRIIQFGELGYDDPEFVTKLYETIFEKSRNTIRKEIDNIDYRVLELLAERFNLAPAVGEYKREHGLEVLDRGREEEIIKERIIQFRELGYGDPEFVTKLYETIFEKSRSLQE